MWYRLSEELLKLNDKELYKLFTPYVERLISLLCNHCQLDEDTSKVSQLTLMTFARVEGSDIGCVSQYRERKYNIGKRQGINESSGMALDGKI